MNRRPVIFGEVLYDCFPDGSEVLGGAPFNVAWHLQAFGVNPLFLSRIGEDAFGRGITEAMSEWGMDQSGLQTDPSQATGRVDIRFSGKEHSFDIVNPSAYDFIQAEQLPAIPGDSILYHGSLALRHEVSRQALEHIRHNDDHPSFIDINLRAPWWLKDHITDLLGHADWIKLNEDELAIVTSDALDFEEQMENLLEQFPARLFFITLGANGAMAFDRSGRQTSIQPEGNSEVVDTVGAGDAFSSVLLLGLLLEWPLHLILERAQAFASAITGLRGATSKDPEFYHGFKTAWDL